MRNFAYVNPEFEQDSVTPELVEGNPCYDPSVYDSVMLEELSDGSYMYMDMTSILLNQEKYRRLLGDMNVQNILTDDDRIILHASRCLTRFCNSSSDVDIESYINKLYRLFLYVYKFFRNWHLPLFGSDVSAYSGRIMFIIKTGIEYEKKKNYEDLRSVYGIRSQYPELSDCMFVLPANGQESDILQSVSCETFQLLEQLRYRSATFCRDMIKHKKLNDANNIFNRMV
jgi:hypothetical protein